MRPKSFGGSGRGSLLGCPALAATLGAVAHNLLGDVDGDDGEGTLLVAKHHPGDFALPVGVAVRRLYAVVVGNCR